MAGLSAEVRDLDAVATGMPGWWAARYPNDRDVLMSPFRTNPASGFSSESLLFDVSAVRAGVITKDELVLRLPPAGGGLFPEYDLARQSRTQELLAAAGIPVPAPTTFEPDPTWIGTPFLVMPRVAGRIPGDYVYPRKGWLHDAGPDLQRAHFDAFVADGLLRLLTLDPANHDTGYLARPAGTGLVAEIGWWSDYLDWATDGERHPVMHDAYEWARATAPRDDDPPSILWGDARFANTIYDASGGLVALLDWEQAAVGPAELDIGFWLATRRQACDVVGVTTDPELPGFRTRDETIRVIETGLRRPLSSLDWHETFAMVRMGTCVVSTAALLVRAGQPDHPFVSAPPLPTWTLDAIVPEV